MGLAAIHITHLATGAGLDKSSDEERDPASRILKHRETIERTELRALFSRVQHLNVSVAVRRSPGGPVEKGVLLRRVFRELLEHKIFAAQLAWEDAHGEHVETLFSTQFGLCRARSAPRW